MDGHKQNGFEMENGIRKSINLLQKDGLRNRGMHFFMTGIALGV